MKILETGENTSLSAISNTFKVVFSHTLSTVGITNTKEVLTFQSANDLDLANLQSRGINEILLFSSSAFNSDRFIKIDFYNPSGILEISSNQSNLESGVTQFGRIYLYNGVDWKFRAMRNLYRSNVEFRNAMGIDFPNSLNSVQPQQTTMPQVVVGQQSTTSNSMQNTRRVFNPNGETISKMESLTLPNDVNSLYIGFGYKSVSNPTGLLQKIVTSQGIDVDMDLSLILLGANGVIDTVTGRNQRSRDGSVYHYGNKGETDGDSEMLSVSFRNLDPNVTAIAVAVTSEKGKFNLLETSTLRLKNQEGMLPLITYRLENNEDKSSCLIAFLLRSRSGWIFQSIESYEKSNDIYNLHTLAKNWLEFMNRLANNRV